MRTILHRWRGHNSSRWYLREWIAEAAGACRPGDRVLDAGAGNAPYRELFSAVKYETADFAQLDKPYAEIDYVCDLVDIPVADGSFDMVICTQTLEHLPDPVSALRELRRVMKPGATLWASAPLFYEEHEQPFDFQRFTQYGWRDMAERADLELIDLAWLEGYYGTLAYQLSMASRSLARRFSPLAFALALIAGSLSRMDTRWKVTDRGMCKNYRVILRRSERH